MDAGDWIAVVAVGIALIALGASFRANWHSAESNRLSRRANRRGKSANDIASDAADTYRELLNIERWRHKVERAKWKEASEEQEARAELASAQRALANRAELYIRVDKASGPAEPAHVVIDNRGPGDAREVVISIESDEEGQPAPIVADSVLRPSFLEGGKEYRIPIDALETTILVTVEWSDARDGRWTKGPYSYYTGPGQDPGLERLDLSWWSRRP